MKTKRLVDRIKTNTSAYVAPVGRVKSVTSKWSVVKMPQPEKVRIFKNAHVLENELIPQHKEIYEAMYLIDKSVIMD